MKEKNFSVSLLHQDMSKTERSCIIKEFSLCMSRVLVITDSTAYGIDVE